jgi:hypothetical protein
MLEFTIRLAHEEEGCGATMIQLCKLVLKGGKLQGQEQGKSVVQDLQRVDSALSKTASTDPSVGARFFLFKVKTLNKIIIDCSKIENFNPLPGGSELTKIAGCSLGDEASLLEQSHSFFVASCKSHAQHVHQDMLEHYILRLLAIL